MEESTKFREVYKYILIKSRDDPINFNLVVVIMEPRCRSSSAIRLSQFINF